MPRVTLRDPELVDGKENTISEYMCDVSGCPNVAEHVIGVVIELRAFAAVCGPHARELALRNRKR